MAGEECDGKDGAEEAGDVTAAALDCTNHRLFVGYSSGQVLAYTSRLTGFHCTPAASLLTPRLTRFHCTTAAYVLGPAPAMPLA